MKKNMIIVGAGLAGLSAALQAVKEGCSVKLISSLPSERAQSVMAEGGINAALNTKGEDDSTQEHYEDTIKAGCNLADPNAVWNMTQAAPEVVKWLHSIGVQFNTCGYDELDLRNFGGQKKKRTAFAKSDTGKQIMTAMIDAVRRLEVQGQIERFEHHSFRTLLMTANICHGCVVCDNYTGEIKMLYADAVIVASGGMHGLFGNTTGSLANTGEVSASLFSAGVPMANLEMIQYHPTTSFWSVSLENIQVFQKYLELTRDDLPVSKLREENLLLRPVTQMALAHAALFARRHGIEWADVVTKLNSANWSFNNDLWYNILVIGSANKKMITGKESIRSAGAVITYLIMGDQMSRAEIEDVRQIIRNARNDETSELPSRI